MTNKNGIYTLSSDHPGDSLEVTCFGYRTIRMPVKKGKKQTINFLLKPDIKSIQTIFIYKDPPEIRLIKRVLKNKKKNRKESLQAYQYKVYEKTKVGDIDYQKTANKFYIPKAFRFFFHNTDTTEKFVYLPLFIIEKAKKVWTRQNPKTEREKTISLKMSGFQNESLSRIFGEKALSVSMYDDFFNLFNKNFISPISSQCLSYYNYTITDTIVRASDTSIRVSFTPKHKQEPVFSGFLIIDASTYALHEIDASMVEEANINFVTGFHFRKTYLKIDSSWMLESEDYHITGKLRIPPFGARRFYGTRSAFYSDYVLNEPKEKTFYSTYGKYDLVKPNQDSTYWTKNRPISLTHNDKTLYLYIDSLKNLRAFKQTLFLFTGYKNIKGFQAGPYFSLYSYNPVEGNRFRLGIRSTPQWNEKLFISTYGAYGTRDERFKYGVGFQYFFRKMPRNYIGLFAKNDIEQFTWSQNYYRTNETVNATLFKVSTSNVLVRHFELKGFYTREWKEGFSNTFMIRRSELFPLQKLKFTHETDQGAVNFSSLVTGEISLLTHFGIKEKFLVGSYKRMSLGSAFPIFDLNLIKGVKGLFGGNYNYTKLIISIRERARMGSFGYTRYRLEAGKFWGLLPYPLLELHNGNRSFFYDNLSFNTMNFLEFVSDQYASLSIMHNFDGFIFNKIPLFRKLKWREIISGKILYGSLNPAQRQVIKLPPNLYSLNHGPFAEAGFGIDNILRIIRLDFLWRLSYLDHPNIKKFKVMGSIHLSF